MTAPILFTRLFPLILLTVVAPALAAQQGDSLVLARGDSVAIHLVDVDVRAAVQALGRYVDRPVIYTGAGGQRVTFETPRPVKRSDVVRLLRGMLDAQSMELLDDTLSGVYRVRQKESPKPLIPVMQQGSSFPTAGQQQELYVIRLRHAKANEVAATVNALYGRASAFGESPERGASNLLSRDLTSMQAPPGIPPDPQAVRGAAGRVATLAGETTIVPDNRGNSLLVRASRQDFALIQAAVTELDVRPLQVLIEVLIAEVRRDRELDFGVDVTVPASQVRGHAATVEGSNNGQSLGDLVVKVMSLGGVDATAVIQAAASHGNVDILSRPVVLAANNERAEINVGSQRPFVQVSRVLPTDNTARDQVVQYKDVGTKLQITPTISADGYVMLQVQQEVNAATAEQQFDAPVISTRSVDTRLLVKDGQTIMIGGLIDRQKEVSQSGVPFLSAIPWIGGFFGRASRRSAETELFLFLTPRVIRQDGDVDAVTQPYQDKAKGVSP